MKRVLALAAIVMGVALLAGCGEQRVTSRIPDLELMDRLNEANDMTKAVAEGTCVSCRYDEVPLNYTAVDIYSQEGYQLLGYNDDGVLTYFFDDGDDVMYMTLYYHEGEKVYIFYDEEQANEFRKTYEILRDYSLYNLGDLLTSRKEQDGILYLTVESELSDYNKEAIAARELDVSKLTRIYEESMYDANTLRLIEATYYCVIDGEVITLSNVYLDFDASIDREMLEENEAAFFGGDDQHTVTIIVGSGTDEEKSYSATLNSDVLIDNRLISTEDGVDLYVDPECTQLYNYEETLSGEVLISCKEDITLYMK